ncbi:MAG TPA: DUF456 domain-containing protein [Chthoniobacteraceae bacterium]|nr:DUF456 domain-containing protein [Chthoniobacteraceae bacterium]
MTLFWWVLTAGLMLFGLVGSIVPFIPGSVIIFAAAVINYLALGQAHSVGIATLVALGVLMVLALGVDLVSGSIGAKWFGASRWGALGGIVGAVVGMFFGLPGVFIGPVVGALLGELLGGRGILPAGRSSWGTLLGTAAGMIGKVGIAFVMVVWFAIAALV